MKRPGYTHKSIYISADAVEVWQTAQANADALGISLSDYVAAALAAKVGNETPLMLARQLVLLLRASKT